MSYESTLIKTMDFDILYLEIDIYDTSRDILNGLNTSQRDKNHELGTTIQLRYCITSSKSDTVELSDVLPGIANGKNENSLTWINKLFQQSRLCML